MLFFYAQCVEHLARHELGQSLMMSKEMLIRFGATVVHKVEPPNLERFRAICSALGLNWINNKPASVEEGRDTILTVLRERGLDISEEQRVRIAECEDIQRLRSWIDRLGTITCAADLLGI